jgi:fibronectin-binding autotransporter adhesin
MKIKSHAVPLLGSLFFVVAGLRAPAQITIYDDADNMNPNVEAGSWSDDNNWVSAPGVMPVVHESPATIGSSAQVQIGTVPSAASSGAITVDTGVAQNVISSLTFNSSLTGSTAITTDGVETLQINGGITNNSNFAQSMELSTYAGASATYAGGPAGGSLVFGQLSLNTFTIATTGTVSVTGELSSTITQSGSTITYGHIGTISNTPDLGFVISTYPTRSYTGNVGDFFQLATGTFTGATASVSDAPLAMGLSWIKTLIQKGILFVEPTAGGTTINSGVVLPIDQDSEFNVAGTGITFNGTTSPAELLTDNSETGAPTPFSTSRTITINASSAAIIAAMNGTTATYTGAISDEGGTAGTLAIGDSTNHGTVVLAGPSTYAGGTTVATATKLEIGNTTGSATGTGAVNLSTGALLQGVSATAAITGQVNLVGSNTVSTSTGTLTVAGGLNVSGTGNTIGTGTINGLITQNAGSALTVSGAAGADNLATTATLTGSGTGSVGAVSLAGGNTLTGPLTTGLITVNGTSASTIVGTVTGSASQSAGSALVVTGTLSGADNLVAGATALSGTGTVGGLVTLNGGGNAISSTGTLNLTGGGIAVNGMGNTIGTGTITGLISQASGSTLTVSGAAGADNLATTATLTGSGTGSVGALALAGGNTITGPLTTGLITVNGTTTSIIAGTVTSTSGASQIGGSALAVNGTLTGPDALAAGTTKLSGTGTVGGLVTLNGGGNVISSTGTLNLTGGGITVNGMGNTIGTGTITGLISQASGSTLTVSGAAGADNLATTATLTGSGTGSVGALALAGGNTITGPLTTGLITVNGTTISTIAGTVTSTSGASQIGGSALAVNGTLTGPDTLAAGTTKLSGTGTVGGLVTLNGGGNAISSTGTLNLTGGGITVNGMGNTIGTGTITGLISQASGSTLTVNGAAGADNLATTATLTGSGTGSVGAVSLAGGNTLTGPLTTGLITVNGTSASASTIVGTITGGASQSAGSALVVTGTLSGADNLVAGATTLSGTGTVGGLVTLNGSGNVISSTGTLNLTGGGIAVNGMGNTIGTGTITGLITQTSGSALTVSGAAGADNLATTATLTGSGTGSVGALALAGGNTITGPLATGLITVNGTATSTSGASQIGGSALAVNGTLTGPDTLAAGTTKLSGTGTVGGLVTLNGGGNVISSTGTLNLTGGGITVNGMGNTIGTGTITGLISQASGSTLTVNGAAGADNLATTATLTGSGTGSVGALALAGGNTITGPLTTGLITVNGTTTSIIAGTVTSTSGASQTAGSALAVNGTLTGPDAVGTGATLSGTGTVGAVTLAGTDTLTSSSTLTTGGITVNGLGNQITSGIVAGNTTLNAGSALTVNGTLNGSLGVGTGTLSGTGTISGPTTVGTGKIDLTTNNAIGTLSVGSLSLTGSTMNFEIGGMTTQTDKIAAGTLTIGGGSTVINISNLGGTAQTLQAGDYTLLSYTNGAAPANLSNLHLNTTTLDGDTLTLVTNNLGLVQVDVTSTSNTQTFTSTSPSTINIITGSTTTVTTSLNNTNPTGGATVAVNLSNNGGTGGAVTGLTSSSGATVAPNSSSTVTGTFTGGTVGTGETYSIKNTDPNATPTTITTGGTANVYNHAVGTLTVTSPTPVKAITGTSVISTLTFKNSGANNDNLTIVTPGTGVTGLSGTFAANAQTTTVHGTTTAGAAGGTTSATYSTTYQEDQTVIGATPGTQTATSGTVTIMDYNHAVGVLNVTSSTLVKAISGTVVNSTLTFANNGANNDNLIAGSAGGGLTAATGTFVANQSTTVNGSFVAGAAGTTATNNYTQSYQEDQMVLGATAGTQTSTAGVTVTSYNHATGALTVTSLTTVKAIAGATVHSTLTFTNSGANNDNLIAGSATGGLTAATGTFIANQSTTLNGAFTAGAAGTTATNTFTQNYQEDQMVLGATAGNQSIAAGVSVTSYNHAVGVLTVTSPTLVKAISGTVVNSTLTFANNGANNDNLTIVAPGTGVTGLSGTFTGNQQDTTVHGATTAGAAGGTTTATYGTTYLEDQSVIGATAGNQTATAAAVTITDYSHAVGVLAVTSPTTIRAIAGTTINSTLTFTNSGATNDNLTAGSVSGGLNPGAMGIFIANQSTTLTGSFVAGAAGTMATNTFTQNYQEDQTVLGATAGTQAATAGVTVTSLGHSAPSLSSTTDNFGFVHEGSTALPNATTTLSNGPGDLAGLQIVSLGGLTDSGTGLIAAGTGRSLSAGISTATAGAYNMVYTIQTEDDQTVVGATANANQTFTVSGNVYTGQGVWNAAGGGTWGTIAMPLPNWTALGGTPGLDANFTTTDSATFGNSIGANTAIVTLDGDNPSLKAVTFDNTDGGNYTIATGNVVGSTLKLNAGANTAAVTDSSGSNTISANMLLNSNTAVAVTGVNDVLTLSGNISGASTSALILGNGGAGTILLSGTNTFTGATMLTSGTTKLGSVNALTSSTSVTQTGGTLDIDGNAQTLQNFSSTGGTLTNSGGGAPATITFDEGGDPVNNSNITGNVAINKTGPGLLALTGNNTYTGDTTLTDGTLEAGSNTAFGMGNVINNGGTLGAYGAQHSINVAMNYTQAVGGTLFINLNVDQPVSASNDVLNVAGTASLNGNLDIHFGFLPVKNDTFVVVTTGGGVTTLGPGFVTPTVIDQIGIDVTGALTDGNHDVTLSITSAQLSLTDALGSFYTPNRAAITTYLSSPTLATTDPILYANLINLVTNSSAQSVPQLLANAADEFNPAKFGNFVQSTIVNNSVFSTQELDSYFEGGRSVRGDFLVGNGTIDSSGLSVVDPSMDPSLAQVSSRLLAWSPAAIGHGLLSDSGDPVMAGVDSKEMTPAPESLSGHEFSTFVVGSVILAQNFSQTDVAHSDTSTGGVQIGADYRITPHLRAGVMFGYSHTDGTLDTNNSTATIDSYAPGAYVTFADNGWYANAMGSYGFNNFTEDRQISLPGGSAVAHGAPSGDQINGDLDGGYDFHIDNFTFGPLAGVQYTHLNVDSYSEDGAEVLGSDLAVGNQKADSLRSRLGGHVSYIFHTGKVLLTPHLDASWQHEFMDQADGITAGVTEGGPAPFRVTTLKPSRDSALLDAGLNAELSGQVSVFGDYLVQAGQSNYFGQSVQAGVKIGF